MYKVQFDLRKLQFRPGLTVPMTFKFNIPSKLLLLHLMNMIPSTLNIYDKSRIYKRPKQEFKFKFFIKIFKFSSFRFQPFLALLFIASAVRPPLAVAPSDSRSCTRTSRIRSLLPRRCRTQPRIAALVLDFHFDF